MLKAPRVVFVLGSLALTALSGLPWERRNDARPGLPGGDGLSATSVRDRAFSGPDDFQAYSSSGPPIRADFEATLERPMEGPASYASGPPRRVDFEGFIGRPGETRRNDRPGPPLRTDFEAVIRSEDGSSAGTADRS